MQEKIGRVILTYEDGADRLEQPAPEDGQIRTLAEQGYDCFSP